MIGNRKIAVILIFLFLLIAPATAAIINTTILRADQIDFTSKYENTYGTDARLSGDAAYIEIKLSVKDENVPVYFDLYLPSGMTYSGSVTKVPNDFLTGNVVTTIQGKTSYTPYNRISDAFGSLISSLYTIHILYATDGTTWYLCAVPRARVLDNTNVMYPTGPLLALYQGGQYGYIRINTDTDAYTTISAPSSVPIQRVYVSSNNPFNMHLVSAIKGVVDYATVRAEDHEEAGTTEDFIQMLIAAFNKITDFLQSIVSWVFLLGWITTFIFAAKVFWVGTAFYFLMAIVLSVVNTDDIMKAPKTFKKFVDAYFAFLGGIIEYTMRLLRIF